MQTCSSDPSNPTGEACVCPNDLDNSASLSSCTNSDLASRTTQGPVSVVSSNGKIGFICQNILRTPPPSCAMNSAETCMCPVGSTATKDVKSGYYCKNNN